jgi:hypothetical protein
LFVFSTFTLDIGALEREIDTFSPQLAMLTPHTMTLRFPVFWKKKKKKVKIISRVISEIKSIFMHGNKK